MKQDKKALPHHADNWNGYSLDELRYQRAVTLAHLEIEKEKLALAAADAREGIPVVGGMRSGIMAKIAGSLSYVDYVVLAFRTFRTISRAIRGLRRKK